MTRKSTLILALAVALTFIGSGCTSVVTLEKPSVTYAAITGGAGLHLTWTAVTDAKNYEIKTDDFDSTVASTVTSFDVTTPTTSISVYAVSGSDKSDPYTLDCKAVVTTSLTVYGKSDTASSHPSGIAFNTDGTAIGVSLAGQSSQVEFIMDDVSFPPNMYMFGPTGYTTPVNSWANAIQESSTPFDSLDIAPAAGNYNLYLQLAVNGTYVGWLDHNADNTIDATDHFCKVKVENINGAVVTLELAYQKIDGLRWLE